MSRRWLPVLVLPLYARIIRELTSEMNDIGGITNEYDRCLDSTLGLDQEAVWVRYGPKVRLIFLYC